MRLMQIDIAAVNLEAMVTFYEGVYQMKLNSFDIGEGIRLYSGSLFGTTLILAPNEVAGVVAEQSRYQFEVVVEDFDGLIARLDAAGGSVREIVGGNGEPRIATVLDPDTNTTIFHEKMRPTDL